MNGHPWKLTLLAAAGLLTLAACGDDNRQQARTAVPDPGPLGYLADGSPSVAATTRVAAYEPDRAYGWAESALAQQRAFYDVPPDYGFDYGDDDYYVWRTDDDWAMYAEPWDDGYRYYYYEPGAAYPYFVRDDDYGYGFDPAGALIAVFTAAGLYLPPERYVTIAPDAGRWWSRGHELRSYAMRAPRVTVNERVWRERAPVYRRTSERWLRAAQEPRWTEWRTRHRDDNARIARVDRSGAVRDTGPRFDREGPRADRRAQQDARKFERRIEKAERRFEKAEAHARPDPIREARRERFTARSAERQGRAVSAFERPGGGRHDGDGRRHETPHRGDAGGEGHAQADKGGGHKGGEAKGKGGHDRGASHGHGKKD